LRLNRIIFALSIVYRHIRKKDNLPLARLIRSVFREFGISRPGTVYTDPTTDDLYSLFKEPGSVYWVAEEDGNIVGGCGIFPTAGLPPGCAELVKLYLVPSKRGQGTGYELMRKSLRSARRLGYDQIYLESLPELSRAISLYKKAGFEFISAPLGNSGHYGCDIWMLKKFRKRNP